MTTDASSQPQRLQNGPQNGLQDAISLSEYRFVPCLQDGVVAFSRGVHDRTGNALMLAHAVSQRVEPDAARRIETEYALRGLLRAEWALVPRALTRYRQGVAAVYDDHTGTPLLALLGQRLPVAQVLSIALGASAALKAVHECGLVHRAITPCSLFVDDAGRCRIGRFGFAIHASQPDADRPAVTTLAGEAPAYMSPEHTGRTRHAIDARSDLYALGVVVYQLLTGQLPFGVRNPDDLGEWIHSHVAGAALPPDAIEPEVPAMLSRIVLKLLEKSPSRRYQTAAGLHADLARCADAWRLHGHIAPFETGERDVSADLALPDGLYARDAELARLTDAFASVQATGTPAVVALTGPSGVGKSKLAQAFAQTMQARLACCAVGKADQFRQNVPYAVLADAFRALVHQILGLPEAAVRTWQLRLVQVLGGYGQVAARIAPALRLLVDDFPPSPATQGVDADVHVGIAMRLLVQAFAQPDLPFVLVMDDIQWLDQPSQRLLSRLADASTPLPLLLVCGARDADVAPLAALRQHAAVLDVPVGNLSVASVVTLLVEALRMPETALQPLAHRIHAKTLGNPFFVRQFLRTLADERLITCPDHSDSWQFDLVAIEQRSYTDNVAELSLQRLHRLPAETRDCLGGMACLGSRSPVTLLCDVFGLSERALHARLAPARAAGLLMLAQQEYVFTHDRIQEAAHDGIDAASRARLSLHAGRLLAQSIRHDARDDLLFRAADLLMHGEAQETSADDARMMAALFLDAARRARSTAAYAAALQYVDSGLRRACGPGVPSPAADGLVFSLLEEQAHCWFLQGRLDDALALATDLLERHTGPLRQAGVYRLKIEIHLRRSENALAVQQAIEGLHGFGIDLPPHPSDDLCDALYAEIQPQLDATRLDALLALPDVADARIDAAMGLLLALQIPASFTDQNLAFATLCQMMRLTLAHGMSGSATASLGWLGVLVCHRYGAYHDGFRYGELARRLTTRHGYAAHEARTLLPLDQLSVWTQPLSYSIECARAGFAAGVAHGDITTACYECCHVVAVMLARGDALDDVEAEISRGLQFVRAARFGDVEAILLLQQRFIDGLRTLAWQTPGVPAAPEPAEERLSTLEFWQAVYRSTVLLLAGQVDAAAQCLDRAATFAWSAPAHIHQLDFHLLRALTLAAQLDASPTAPDAPAWQTLRADARRLRDWAHANPLTFTDKALLAEAELARLEGDVLTAMSRYEQAIAHAAAHGFVQITAIAHERAARLGAAQGLASTADAHRRHARDAYLRWGAMGKARQLETEFPEIVETAPLRTWHLGASAQTLDAESVIKASRALSEEIRLDRLIDKLMTVVLEYAGAQRGLLIRMRPEGPVVEASADTTADGIRVRVTQDPVTPSALPVVMLRTAVRTGQPAMTGMSVGANPFAIDPYFGQVGSQAGMSHGADISALCIPMLRHNEAIGALYLENRLVRDAFTLDRTRVLELIASQAAISLRTARLYDDLLAENERRQQVERELRASEASLAMGESVSHTGSWRWDLKRDRFTGSDELRRIYELDPDQHDLPFEVFLSHMHPEDREMVRHITETHVARQATVRVEHRIVRADGSIRYLAAIGKPLPGDDGEIDYVGTVTDITARRQGEDALRSAQADLARVARATTVGQLTASIAHEVNQPLMSIVSNAGASLRWLARPTPDIANAREGLEAIRSEGQRAGDMIRSLQALTRNAAPVMAQVDIHQAIRHILAISRTEIERRQIALKLSLEAEPAHAFGDDIQLQQVILNLVVNAIDAMSEIHGRTRVLHLTTRLVDDHLLEVSVADTGTGIGQDLAEQVFEPFYTTKVNGMGMGLAICKSIVEAHRGQLRAEALVPHGSRFAFSIPRQP
ncbi:trifunctional serine/threonine-protein kinase/ATP-binding protein/sensor histidine kinase [Cupriavidus pauculus]|uniref:histidine kinase n=1 Tax=Cupriavidus pauculus TaxID=82633 RepID=A0A2N5C7H0_9BURK|nr:AAA family ATPase [Cupriavidus pauculus]PLP98130.1 histidine kinase [Cupriavidus pauculus]